MIVKDHEKKACGFISVTWITMRAHVSALPGPHGAVAIVYTGCPREATAARARRCARSACHRGRRAPAGVPGRRWRVVTACPPRARAPRQCRSPRAGRGWPASQQVMVPGLAAVAISGWRRYRPATITAG